MGERRRTPNHSISAVFIFLLLGIFAALSLVLVLFGAQAYRNTVEKTACHNNTRVLNSYIRNNLRTGDVAGGIAYDCQDGIVKLMISDPDDAGEYIKYIYAADGNLWELYTETSETFDPEDGEVICAAEKMDVTLDNGLIIVTIQSNNIDYRTVFALHCEEETA